MTVWKRRDDWVGSQVDDQYVMIHLDSGRYMALNQTATAAWEALEKPTDRNELVALFVEKFAIGEEDCARSVDAMLDRMAHLELIEATDDTTISTSN